MGTRGHLPYEATEDAYRQDAYERYNRVENDVSTLFSDDSRDEITTGELAALSSSWIASRISTAGLEPSSTLPTGQDEFEWFDRHAYNSYQQGREFARDAMTSRGYSPPQTPGISQSPRHQRAITQLHERQRRYWGSLATDLQSEVRETLTNRIDEGATIRQARNVVADRVEKTGLDRARKIANTEPAWGFNRAMVEEYADAGMSNVHVDVSWETAGDDRVCAECLAMEGTYRVGEAREMFQDGTFPAHPEDRCLLLPG